MSNQHNEEALEQIHEEVLEQDTKGLLDNDINNISKQYNLNVDDDRDEILQFISENIFYNNKEDIERMYKDVPRHLKHLSKDKLKALFHIFAGKF